MSTALASTRAIFALLLAALLAGGCGFHLRGQADLPFATLNVPGNSPLLAELRRNIRTGTPTDLVATAAGADAVFEVASEVREKVILSLDTTGRVREFQLRYRVAFRVHDGKGRTWLAPDEIVLTRDISFNDGQVLAKESEEALLYRDMQSDMVQQIMRRLAAIRLAPAG
jgi:LPS-assembly lipoprotein